MNSEQAREYLENYNDCTSFAECYNCTVCYKNNCNCKIIQAIYIVLKENAELKAKADKYDKVKEKLEREKQKIKEQTDAIPEWENSTVRILGDTLNGFIQQILKEME